MKRVFLITIVIAFCMVGFGYAAGIPSVQMDHVVSAAAHETGRTQAQMMKRHEELTSQRPVRMRRPAPPSYAPPEPPKPFAGDSTDVTDKSYIAQKQREMAAEKDRMNQRIRAGQNIRAIDQELKEKETSMKRAQKAVVQAEKELTPIQRDYEKKKAYVEALNARTPEERDRDAKDVLLPADMEKKATRDLEKAEKKMQEAKDLAENKRNSAAVLERERERALANRARYEAVLKDAPVASASNKKPMFVTSDTGSQSTATASQSASKSKVTSLLDRLRGKKSTPIEISKPSFQRMGALSEQGSAVSGFDVDAQRRKRVQDYADTKTSKEKAIAAGREGQSEMDREMKKLNPVQQQKKRSLFRR